MEVKSFPRHCHNLVGLWLQGQKFEFGNGLTELKGLLAEISALTSVILVLEFVLDNRIRFLQRRQRSVAWELIRFGTFSRRGLNPIQLVYDPD